MAKKKFEIITFTVEGTGAFPLDMLRYDSCWPHSSEDACKIGITHDDPACFEIRRVSLQTYAHQDRGQELTPDRWRSFHWPVVETTET